MAQSVLIVGVGLIGGSFALALREAGFKGVITGVSSPARVHAAIDLGIIDKGATLEEAAPEADLIYLAQPILRILDSIGVLSNCELRPDCLITDAGSTKQAILEKATALLPQGSFLGGHPMAGKESRGPENAEATLFSGRTYFLVSPQQTPRFSAFFELIERIGANPVWIDAAAHDQLVAATSHTPQLISTALAAWVGSRVTPEKAQIGSGQGLRDMTRLALSDFEIWSEIVMTNTEAISLALESYIAELQRVKAHLDSPTLEETFELGKKFSKLLRLPR